MKLSGHHPCAIIPAFWLLLTLPFPGNIAAQEQATGTEEEAAEAASLEDAGTEEQPGAIPKVSLVFYIRSVDFEVDGRTKPFALTREGEFKIGERINGEAALEKYIAGKTQLLINQRVLESVEIEYIRGEKEETGTGETLIPVDLLVRVKDSWNVIAIPYPKYDDNTGFELILKARDYNFLGTMNPLRIDLGYKRSTAGKNAFLFEIDSDTPFMAFGYRWNFNFDHAFGYTYEQPLYYKNTTGLSIEIPFKTTAFTFGFNEFVIVNEENSDSNKQTYGERFDGGYMSSEFYSQWKIPTGLKAGGFGELTYTPSVTGNINYLPGGAVDYPRQGMTLTLSHSLGFGQVNWIGNYRQGLETSLENSNSYNIYKKNWNRNLTFNFKGYYQISKLFGLSGQFRVRNRFDDPLTDAGDDLRGILNKAVEAKTMLSLNMDFPFRLLHLYPSELFHSRKLRYFDFELHVSPIIDLALVQGKFGDPGTANSMETTSFDLQGLLCTGGLEMIVFPAFMRSLYLRASVGWNLREVIKTASLPSGINREIYVGLGHHY